MRLFLHHRISHLLKSIVCLVLSLAMVVTLISPELLMAQTSSASDGGTAQTVSADNDADTVSYTSDEVIIVYHDASSDPASDEVSASVLDEAGVTVQEEIAADDADGTTVLAQLDESVSVEEAIEILEADPAVDYVQPNYSYTVLAEETEAADEVTSDASEALQYYLYGSSFTDAWEYARSEGTVTVAVLDTGCNLEHEDLIDTVNAQLAYDVTTGTLLSESGTANGGDAMGHGTAVCGVISASADNGTGIAGASYNADVLPVKVFDADGNCTTADLIAAYEYLESLIESGDLNDLKVINISLGYYADSTDDEDAALEAVISSMRSEYGVLTVCAGGNGSNGRANTAYCYPADFEACVSVTAVDEDGANASFSDYNDAKDIAAYGVDIYTTAADGGYTSVTGTSVASPQVAAAAALLWAADASLSTQEVVSLLQDSSDEVTGNLHETTMDNGIVDAQAAVMAALGIGESDTDTAASDETAEIDETTETDETAQTGETEETDETAQTDETTETDESEEATAAQTDTSDTEEETEDEELEIEAEFDSWRYSNGRVNRYADTDSLAVMTLASSYSIWKKSYGTSYFGIQSGSSVTKVSVSGVKRVVIDVSKWQGSIDWAKVKAAGITAAIIRCGYGKDSTSYDDSYFLQNVEGALENGIEIGIYLYSYATTTTYAASEASHVLRLLASAGLSPDDLDLPVFLDMEDSTQGSLSASKLGSIAQTFCDAISEEGYAVGIYSSKSWWESKLTNSAFDSNDWFKWVARYPTSSSVSSSGISDADIWQFTSSGTVSGISGSVDVSFDYLGSGSYASSNFRIKSVTLNSTMTKATVKWATVSWADGYEIWRSVDGGSYELVKTLSGGTVSSWSDSTIELGKTYTYKVRPYRTVTETVTTEETIVDEETGEETVTEVESTVETALEGSFSGTLSVTTLPDKVTIGTATATLAGNIKVTWTALSNVTGYEIYRSVDGGSYEKVKTITKASTVSWTDKTITSTGIYRYKIRAYMTSGTTTVYSASYSAVKKVTLQKPSKVSITSAAVTTTGYVKVKWKKTSNVVGYVIYRSVNGGSYKAVKTITNRTTVSWTDKTVVAGRAYRYKIKAFVRTGSKTVYSGSYSAVKKVTAKPAKASITSAKSTKSKSMTIKWKKVSGATGYQVAYRIKGTSKWYYVSVKSAKKVFTSLRNKKYYVKVRAYKTYNGKKYYGSWSSSKLVTIK